MYYLNGRIEKEEILSNDFFYGESIFETMYGKKMKIFFLEEHLERLKKSMDFLGISNKIDFYKLIDEFIKQHEEIDEFIFKIQVSSKNLYMKLEKFQGREAEKGIEVSFVKEIYQNELGFLKSGNYLGNIIVRKNLKGFEGIFLNRLGQITEGTISNLFFIKNEVIYTPSLDLNILSGITRKIIIKLAKINGIEVQEGHFYKKDIEEADAIFFTNSLMKKGLLWVSKLENLEFKKVEKIHKLEKEYLKMLDDMI